jgi:hypothetical protein
MRKFGLGRVILSLLRRFFSPLFLCKRKKSRFLYRVAMSDSFPSPREVAIKLKDTSPLEDGIFMGLKVLI